MRFLKYITILGLGFSIIILSSAVLLYNYNRTFVFDTYNEIRPLFLRGGGDKCLSKLEERGISFQALGNQGDKICPVLNAIKITELPSTSLSSSIILSCPAAVKFADWVKKIEAKSLAHMGTLNCRKMRSFGIMSEHSYGLAIDISKIDEAIIKTHWNNSGSKGRKLRTAAKEACSYFTNVLTPDSNRLHYDHFHLDLGIGLPCLRLW